VQKHFLDDINGDSAPAASRQTRTNGTLLAPGERPPFDPDAT
jgi:hypothetical protein